MPLKPRAQAFLCPMIAEVRGVLLHDQSRCLRAARFHVLVVDAVIADHGRGERDHLAAIGRIGENYLITGNARIENKLPKNLPFRTERLPCRYEPVFQDKCGFVHLFSASAGIDFFASSKAPNIAATYTASPMSVFRKK